MTPPLPEANKKSPRVYRNLQTKDLEDVTFSDVEATGDPLSIEIHNEDELRRLVLVQLARLTVKSEWTGLLTSSAVSFPLLAPNGSSGAPSYSFTNDTDAGMYLTSAGTLSFPQAVKSSESARQGYRLYLMAQHLRRVSALQVTRNQGCYNLLLTTSRLPHTLTKGSVLGMLARSVLEAQITALTGRC